MSAEKAMNTVQLTPMEQARIAASTVEGGLIQTVEDIIQERIDTITADALVPLLAQKFRAAWIAEDLKSGGVVPGERSTAGIRAVLAALRGE